MIRFENVTKNYKDSVVALRDISLEIQRGEFVFLVGASGSGKTTFLRLLLREEAPDDGSIWVAGRDIGELSQWRVPYLRRNLGCVFQDFRLLPNKTVHENVAFALEVIGRPRSVVKVQVPQVLELVGLGQKGNRMPHELSGGEQQRVAVARAFVNRPLVLLADEPTGNLDPATSQGIMKLLDRINRTGTTIVMATHDVGIVDTMRRRVIELDRGHLVRDQARGVYGTDVPTTTRGVPAVSVSTGGNDLNLGDETDEPMTGRVASVRAVAVTDKATMAVSIDYVVKETATNLWRNRMMALAAVLTVAVTLSLVGAALLLRQAVNRQIGEWGNNVSLQVFLVPTVTSQEIASVHSLIKQAPQVTHCTYLNHEQSYEQAKRVLSGEPTAIGALTPATTPPVFRCQLANPNDAATVAAIFHGVPGVYNATYPGQSIKVMQQVTSVIQIILFFIAVVLLISSLVLILNAIRMAIFARRREIGVMKLVGATNWFIRIPFMLEGLVQGLLGAIVAVVVVLLSNIGVNYLVVHYVKVLSSSVLPVHDLVVTEILVVAVGAIIGVAGSSVAVRRFLDV